MESLLIVSFIAIIILMVGMSIGAAIDDIRSVRRQRDWAAHPYSRRYKARPLVTVLLTVDTDPATTRRALKAILGSSYRQLEIILVSTRRRRRELTQTARVLARPRRPIAVYTGSGTLAAAYRRYGHGSLILTTSSRDELDSQAIKQAVWHFAAQEHLTEIRASSHVTEQHSTTGLLQEYARALTYSWSKLANLITSADTARKASAHFCRAEAFRVQQPQQTAPAVYFAEDVIVRQRAVALRPSPLGAARESGTQVYRALWSARNPQRIVRWYWRLLAACLAWTLVSLPILLTYAMLLAFRAHQPLLLFVSLGAAGVAITLGLWSQTGISRRHKINLTILLPVCVIPFYVMTFVYALMTLTIVFSASWKGLLKATSMSRKLLPR